MVQLVCQLLPQLVSQSVSQSVSCVPLIKNVPKFDIKLKTYE